MKPRFEDKEDERIQECSICGGKAYWKEFVINRGFNKTGILPRDGDVFVDEKKTVSGRIIYYWERYGYSIHCMTPKCPCRAVHNGYLTLDEAIDKWNNFNRVEDKK